MTRGSFLPFSVFLQALTQGVALVVNTIAEVLAGLGVSIIGASVRALELRIARADVVHKLVDDDHRNDGCDNASEKHQGKLAGCLLIYSVADVAR